MKTSDPNPRYGGRLGFEPKLSEVADFLRRMMDPAEFKHVIFGLLPNRPRGEIRVPGAEAVFEAAR